MDSSYNFDTVKSRDERIAQLNSQSPQERGYAALYFMRERSEDGVRRVKALLDHESNLVVRACVIPSIVGLGDEYALQLLDQSDLDERILYPIVMSFKYQKRVLPQQYLDKLKDHNSIFVRLSLLEYYLTSPVSAGYIQELIAGIRLEATPGRFQWEEGFLPSHIFSDRNKFLNRLSYLKRKHGQISECQGRAGSVPYSAGS